MKVAFIGGGSFRTLPILRGAMAIPGVLDHGEIRLVDRDVGRAEAVGRMIQKTPEYAGKGCRVSWGMDLDRALDGVDLVSVSFAVGTPEIYRRSMVASREQGFHGSDQLSLTGAFLALTAGSSFLTFARAMERRCPKALMIDFANPVAVYSGVVNNHSKISALGICGGFRNSCWDLTRLLGRDEYCDEYDLDVAGVNHMSFILRGTYRGKDLYELLGRRLRRKDWKPVESQRSGPVMAKHIWRGQLRLAELYRRFGKIIFSTEGDGMIHLFMMEEPVDKCQSPTLAEIRAQCRQQREQRQAEDVDFRSHLERDLDAAFWAGAPERSIFGRADTDLAVLIMRALSGRGGPVKIVASRPNDGAVAGFKDRTVLEYSMMLDRKGIRPVPNLEVPDVYHGLVSALATHQTLLGDAIAAQDPRLLAEALFAYPAHQNSPRAGKLWRTLLRIHAPDIPKVFQKATDYF